MQILILTDHDDPSIPAGDIVFEFRLRPKGENEHSISTMVNAENMDDPRAWAVVFDAFAAAIRRRWNCEKLAKT